MTLFSEAASATATSDRKAHALLALDVAVKTALADWHNGGDYDAFVAALDKAEKSAARVLGAEL